LDRLRRWLLGIALFVLLPAVVVAALLWHRAAERRAELVQLFEEVAEAHRSTSHTRAPDPPGWPLQPGAAAEPYQRAWDACDLEDWPDATAENLRRTRLALFEPELRALDAPDLPLFEPGERAVPPACAALGVPADSDDLLLAQLDQDLCERLAACRPALELVAIGSRCQDTTSPMRIWSEFATVGPGQLRSFVPYLRLGQLGLLQGYLAGAAGDRDAHLDAIYNTMRLAQDVSRGSGLVGAMVAVAILDRASRDLEWLLQRDDLSVDQARRARAELAYVNLQPLDVAGAMQAEFLNVSALWFEPGEVGLPPTTTPVDPASWSLGDRFAVRLASRDLARSWRDLLDMQSLPYPDRARQYPRIEQLAQSSGNPLVAMQPDYGRFDVRITAVGARLAMLQVALDDLVVRRERGALPARLEDLVADVPLDPLSGQPFTLERRGDQRLLYSPAIGSTARLGLDHVAHQIRPEIYLRVRLPSGLQEPPGDPLDPEALPTSPVRR